jgi:hypothetical protein
MAQKLTQSSARLRKEVTYLVCFCQMRSQSIVIVSLQGAQQAVRSLVPLQHRISPHRHRPAGSARAECSPDHLVAVEYMLAGNLGPRTSGSAASMFR